MNISTKSTVNEQRSDYSLRLMRNKTNINQLERKLYACEPCTRNLFELKHELETQLNQLKNSNQQLSESLHQNRLTTMSEVIMKQIRDFNEVRKGVIEYMRMSNPHLTLTV